MSPDTITPRAHLICRYYYVAALQQCRHDITPPPLRAAYATSLARLLIYENMFITR